MIEKKQKQIKQKKSFPEKKNLTFISQISLTN